LEKKSLEVRGENLKGSLSQEEIKERDRNFLLKKFTEAYKKKTSEITTKPSILLAGNHTFYKKVPVVYFAY
jgi:hypothetical protein